VNFLALNLTALLPFLPLMFFIIAVSFRLLDNSSLLFLQKDILVTSSNVSRKLLKKQIRENEDREFTQKLKRALLFRNLQQSFLIFSVATLPFLAMYLF